MSDGVLDGGSECSAAWTASFDGVRIAGKYSCVGGALLVVVSGGVGMQYISELMRVGIGGMSSSG